MRDNEYPTPVSDTEAQGLPDTADDDSTANDDVLTGREADGPDPAQLPGDRTPVAVDRFGTTAEEQLDGESLDYKLDREVYERPADDPLAGTIDPKIAFEADNLEAAAEAQLDADVMDPGPTSDPNSPVSLYDHGQLGTVADATVGRLVEPDEGCAHRPGDRLGGVRRRIGRRRSDRRGAGHPRDGAAALGLTSAQSSRPRSMAYRVSSTRLCSCSLPRVFCTWFCTVRCDRPSRCGDLLVRQPLGHQPQHLRLPVGEPGRRTRRAGRPGRLPRSGGQPAVLAEHQPGQARGEDRARRPRCGATASRNSAGAVDFTR